jgi:hypothetical protein
VPRRTRKQLVGKWQENSDRQQSERDVRTLEQELRQAWFFQPRQFSEDLTTSLARGMSR